MESIQRSLREVIERKPHQLSSLSHLESLIKNGRGDRPRVVLREESSRDHLPEKKKKEREEIKEREKNFHRLASFVSEEGGENGEIKNRKTLR